jgi:hypothetical protein
MSETPMLSIGMLNDGIPNSLKIEEVGIGLVLTTTPMAYSMNAYKMFDYYEKNPGFSIS